MFTYTVSYTVHVQAKPDEYGVKGEEIAEAAKSYLGIPYVWGGAAPSGFDCSGFVQYLYRAEGLDLPRTSREMFAIVGVHVSEPQPGDLVFFANNGSPSHVGIYMGNNQFISATTSYGVKMSNLYSSYWGPRYIGAKRIN